MGELKIVYSDKKVTPWGVQAKHSLSDNFTDYSNIA
jgi:hypothetical protein